MLVLFDKNATTLGILRKLINIQISVLLSFCRLRVMKTFRLIAIKSFASFGVRLNDVLYVWTKVAPRHLRTPCTRNFQLYSGMQLNKILDAIALMFPKI